MFLLLETILCCIVTVSSETVSSAPNVKALWVGNHAEEIRNILETELNCNYITYYGDFGNDFLSVYISPLNVCGGYESPASGGTWSEQYICMEQGNNTFVRHQTYSDAECNNFIGGSRTDFYFGDDNDIVQFYCDGTDDCNVRIRIWEGLPSCDDEPSVANTVRDGVIGYHTFAWLGGVCMEFGQVYCDENIVITRDVSNTQPYGLIGECYYDDGYTEFEYKTGDCERMGYYNHQKYDYEQVLECGSKVNSVDDVNESVIFVGYCKTYIVFYGLLFVYII
eukprot:311911_1